MLKYYSFEPSVIFQITVQLFFLWVCGVREWIGVTVLVHSESVITTRVETHTLETRGPILASNSRAVVRKSKREVFLSPAALMQSYPSSVAFLFMHSQTCSCTFKHSKQLRGISVLQTEKKKLKLVAWEMFSSTTLSRNISKMNCSVQSITTLKKKKKNHTPTKTFMNCSTSYVIYVLKCPCDLHVGKTHHPLKTRSYRAKTLTAPMATCFASLQQFLYS